MSDTDLQLLARYTRQHAEDAFAEIVRRHLDLVFSAALRQVRSPQLAEEVAQSTFTDLARNAHHLASGSDAPSPGSLTPWLYQVTRRTAIDVVRRESRRRLREQIATEMNAMNATADDWVQIEPLLDEAMHTLDETDRAAVLLRYFENKSLREVGETLGASEDAARKRVSRAVEHLREFFAKRGVTVGASGLVVVISANAVQAAPVGLAVAISTAVALAGTTIVTTTTATATKAIAMTSLQKTIIGTTLAAAVGTGIYEASQAAKLRNENNSLQNQTTQLKSENDELSNRLTTIASAKSPPANSLADEQFSELLRLRGEVGVLRRQLADLNAVSPHTKSNWTAANRNIEGLPRNFGEYQARWEEMKQKWVAAVKKVERLAGELNVPTEIATNTTAHTNLTNAQLSAYEPYFEAVRNRDQMSRFMGILERKLIYELFDTDSAIPSSP